MTSLEISPCIDDYGALPMTGAEAALLTVSPAARAAFGVIGALAPVPFDRNPLAAALGVSPVRAGELLDELLAARLVLRKGRAYQVANDEAHAFARRELAVAHNVLARLATYWIEFARTEAKRAEPGYARLDRRLPHLIAMQEVCLAAGHWEPVRQLAWRLWTYLPESGCWQERITVLSHALTAAHAAGHRHDEETFVNELAYTYFSLGELSRAVECYEWALYFAQAGGNRNTQEQALTNLGAAHFAQGEIERAIEFYNQALALACVIGDRPGECAVLGDLATAYYALGKAEVAVDLCLRQLDIALELGSRAEQKNALNSLGNAYVFLAEHEQAIACYEQCLALATEDGDAAYEATALWGLGACRQARGELDRALDCYKQQVALNESLGDRHMEVWGKWHLGLTYERLGDHAQAVDLMQALVDYLYEIGHPEVEAFAEQVAKLRVEVA